jgi:galactose mutarotase-like enzyme
MIYTIENEFLKVDVDTAGAQLQSVVSKETNVEYIWQGDPAYWSGRAYNLFPFIGRRFKNVYVYKDEEYRSRAHGLARYYAFRLEERTATKLVLLFTENEETLQEYPFHFEFRVVFELKDSTLTTRYHVTNTDEKELICSFGGHPGINVPFGNGMFEDYYLEFSEKTNVHRQLLSESDRFMADKAVPYALEDGVKLPLRHDLFDHDAVILSNTSREVAIKSDLESNYVSARFDDFKYVGFWHPGKTDAPFVCIEPWGSLPAIDNVIENLETKDDMVNVPAGKAAEVSFDLTIHEND